MESVNLFGIQCYSDDNKYTKKASIPQYIPTDYKPSIYELFDTKKYYELIHDIETSNANDEQKEYLRFAATRHIGFNYAKIADYYANSDKELQKLFEDSALVIIDPQDAIANGYMKLTKDIERIMKQTGKKTGEQNA